MLTARIQHSNTTLDTLVRPSTTLCIDYMGFLDIFGDWFRIDPKLLIMDFLKSPIVRLLTFFFPNFWGDYLHTFQEQLELFYEVALGLAGQWQFNCISQSWLFQLSCLVLSYPTPPPPLVTVESFLCKGSWLLSKWWLARHDWVSSNSRKTGPSTPIEESSLVTHI